MKVLLNFFLAALVVATCLSCSGPEKGTTGGNADSAPAFTLSNINNDKMRLSDYRGRVVMVEFFASWCPPCQMVAPEVKSIYEKYKDKGFVVVAVAIDEGANATAAVSGFIKDFGITYPVLLDDGTVSRKYQVISIPTSFLIDKQGKLRNKHIGVLPDFANTISREIETLL
jgi:thiol-disulfide isomerase/thioredoxin